MKILHIDSSALGAMSVSRELTAATVYQLQETNPAATVTYRDLAAAPPAHLDGVLLAALRLQEGCVAPQSLRAELDLTEKMLGEFLAADVVMVGAPMSGLLRHYRQHGDPRRRYCDGARMRARRLWTRR